MDKTVTQFPRRKASRFKVGLVAEFYKEFDVIAIDAQEAAEIAENRQRRAYSSLKQRGYVIGDIEVINVETADEDRR